MYKLLIVDDEKAQINGIHCLAEQKPYPLEVFETTSGLSALEQIRNNLIDILITDIKMPLMNGFELIEEAKTINPKLKIVMLSAYDDFQYAKKAMALGAVNYLLKPVDPDEFHAIMSEVIDACDREVKEEAVLSRYYSYEQEKVLNDLIGGKSIDEKSLEILRSSGFEPFADSVIMLMISLKSNFFDENNDIFIKNAAKQLEAPHYHLNLNEFQSLMFLQNVSADKKQRLEIGDVIKRILLDCNVSDGSLIFSGLIGSKDGYAEEFKVMDQIADFRVFSPEFAILFSDDVSDFQNSDDSADVFVQDINTAIGTRSIADITLKIEQFFRWLQQMNHVSSVYVRYYSIEIFKSIIKEFSQSQAAFSNGMGKIFTEPNLIEIKNYLIDVVNSVQIVSQDSGEFETVDDGKRVIRDVIAIVEAEYGQNIGLDYVAEKVFLSPTYLSYLFKRETGQSFLKFLTQYRLSKSAYLLTNTYMKVTDICKNVGYTKLSYFCMIFKNNYGVTPLVYRERGQ